MKRSTFTDLGHGDSFQLFVPAVSSDTPLTVHVNVGDYTDTRQIHIAPVKSFDLYLIMHTHTDLGYTQPQLELVDLHMDFIDKAVDYVQATRDRPDAEQFRWTCETSWAVQQYLQNRSPEQIKAFINCVKTGHIAVTGMYHNQTALSGYEEMANMVSVAKDICKTYDIPVLSAMNSDVNGIARGYVPLLNAMGVKNLNMAINWTKGGPPFRNSCPNGFIWKAPDGSEMLVWNSDGYQKGNQLGLLPLSAQAPLNTSWEYAGLINKGYPLDFISVQIQGIGGDNRPPNKDICDVVRSWNATWANPRLRLATLDDYFERLQQDRDKLPQVTGEWPDWWSDGVASTAFTTGLSREAAHMLKTDAALAALNPDNTVAREINDLYLANSIYNEHTWGGHNSIDEPWVPYHQMIWNWKAGHVYRAWHGALKLGERLLERYSTGQPYEILVFNPYTETYKGPVKASVYRRGRSILRGGYKITDEHGKAVLAEWQPGSDWAHLILNLEIAPLNFRRLIIVPGGERTPLTSVCTVGGQFIESPFYRMSWNDTGITSIYDKKGYR